MLKEASKALILCAALTLGACSGSDPDKEAANAMVAEASTALDRGDYAQAEALLDSLSATYPKQIEAGRAALALRPRVMERKTEQEIADLQAEMLAASAYVDSISGLFNSVPASDDVFEPYMIHKDVPANWRDRNTAVARLTPAGEFYMISSLAGNSTRHTSIRLSARGTSAESGVVKNDPEDRLSRESLRFPAAKADTLGVYAVAIDGSAATLTFAGGKKAPTANLSAKEVHAIADTYRLSQAMGVISAGNRRLEQLKAKLQLARDQAARTNVED
ncbi:MAG: hypothetical protein K2L05_03795 [Muribaculaceae bacterium]|nr:hypothetical protein [Muribaculaceae bacterium]